MTTRRTSHAQHAVAGVALALLCQFTTQASCAPITPTHDDEVIEVLPAMTGGRAEERRLRKQLALQPRDPALAVGIAKRYLAQAHERGDPRFAGMAMAAIEGWTNEATMPDDVLMMRATLQQYLHAFDGSAHSLQVLLARPGAQPRAQAWLTLATVGRVQGRYADSDLACQQVATNGAALHAQACLAENAALRGDVDPARVVLTRLLAAPDIPVSTRAWLTTSRAELEQRAGHAAAAEASYRAAVRLEADAYATLSFADFLIEQKRPAEALVLLKGQARSDAVLLRLSIAGVQARASSAVADAAEMRERIALANERPDAKVFHGREQAMFALWVERRPERALALAHGNVRQQREPQDLLVLAQAARATGRTEAMQEVRNLLTQMGLRDQRAESVLGHG